MRKTFFYISLFIMTWIYTTQFKSVDWDLWARLAVGKIFFETGWILKNDIFSYTITKPIWVDHEWGSGVVFYFLADHFGDIGLLLLKIIGTFLIVFLLSKIIEMQNIKPNQHLKLMFYILTLMGIYYGVSGTVRCQLFTFIFFTLWIYVLERVRRGETRLLWILPTTSLIWANLHGGFVAGLGLIGIYGIGEFLNRKPFKKYFLILIPATLITLINPYGVEYWSFILHAATMARITISEWLPTGIFPLDKWKGFKVFTAIALLSWLYSIVRNIPKSQDLIKRYHELDKVKYLLLFVTLYLAMRYNKHQSLFVISATAFLYHHFYTIFDTLKEQAITFIEQIKRFESINIRDKATKILAKVALVKDVLVFAIIIGIGGLLVCTAPLKFGVDPSRFPVSAVEFMKKNNISGNTLTLFHWGSYVAWKLYPDNLIAEDGRYEEVYPEDLHMKVYNFNYKINDFWLSFLNEYHTDVILMEKANRSYPAMLQVKEWKQIYDDPISAVFVPVHKAKKSYLMPKIHVRTIFEEKYDTKINFR
ncbi:MAG: hypothetical protein ACD_20C00172G0017 [uncultured bacterium]|nr:MAG: hypothetical protein ACD_20C00172G0017 [uncultured bacterium]HBH18157.1 hypothetical protein [Cyanobacteria bacterium UBA9579]